MNKNIWVPIVVVVAVSAGLIGGYFLEKYLGHQEKTSLSALTASMAKAASDSDESDESESPSQEELIKGQQQAAADRELAEQSQEEEQQDQQQPALMDLVRIMGHDSYKDPWGITIQTQIKIISRIKGLVINGIQLNGGDCYQSNFKHSYTLVQDGYLTVSTKCQESSIFTVTIDSNYGVITGDVEF